MRLTRYSHPALLGLLAVLALSCNGEGLVVPSTGTLKVTTTTNGTDPDVNGYTVQLDSRKPRVIGSAATLQSPDLPAGDHVVLLGGLAANCSVVGENPRTVRVTVGATASVFFAVSCSTTTGTMEIAVTTSGESLDPDGFTINLDSRRFLPSSITEVIKVENVLAGDHTVALDGVAPNCTASEGLSQTIAVSPGVQASIQFTVVCTFAGVTRWTTIALPPTVTAEIGFGTSRSLWGTSPTDLFVVGWATEPQPRSGIWHYDGQGWTEQVSRVDTALVGIWGASATDVFAIGRPATLDPSKPGAILHYDGSRWSDMTGPAFAPPAFFISYAGLWGAGARDVFLAGDRSGSTPSGTALLGHYDGTRWSEMRLPAFGDYPGFTDLSGTSATDVWAIGDRQKCDDCNYTIPMVVHYNGTEWTDAQPGPPANEHFYGIWAISENDVWVVGRNADFNGHVLHFDGTNWSGGDPLSTIENTLEDVWASSASDVYAVGAHVVLRYDGTGWNKISNVGGDRVWGTSSQDVFVLRPHEILHGKP
jgi:hypothetical protein